MPTYRRPQIGETWRSSSGTEAVVVAVLDESVRMMSRTGRYTHTPAQSLMHIWTCIHPAPDRPGYCESVEGCRNEAYFQFEWQGSIIRSCQNHILLGGITCFPWDDLEVVASHGTSNECPNCLSTLVESEQVEKTQAFQPPPRACSKHTQRTIVFNCGGCSTKWVSVHGRGEGSDGRLFEAVLSEAVGVLEEEGKTLVTYAGFSALRALEKIKEVETQDIQETEYFGSNTITIMKQGDNSLAKSEASRYAETLPFLNSAQECFTKGSHWRRLYQGRPPLVCEILNSDPLFVEYNIIDNPCTIHLGDPHRLMLRTQFEEHWVPALNYADQGITEMSPNPGSYWQSGVKLVCIEHKSRVVVGPISQCRYVSVTDESKQCRYASVTDESKQRSSVNAFLKLYRELPNIRKTLWVKGLEEVDGYRLYTYSVVSESFADEQGRVAVNICREDQEEPVKVGFYELMENYSPIIFLENTPLTLNSRREFLTGARWLNKETQEAIFVYDFGYVRGDNLTNLQDINYVRYSRFEHLCDIAAQEKSPVKILRLDTFIETYEYPRPDPPCSVGDEYKRIKDAEDPVVEDTLHIVEDVLFDRVMINGETLYFDELQENFVKVVRKGLFQILEEDDWV